MRDACTRDWRSWQSEKLARRRQREFAAATGVPQAQDYAGAEGGVYVVTIPGDVGQLTFEPAAAGQQFGRGGQRWIQER